MDCEYKIPFPGVGVGCGYGTDMKPTCWLNTRMRNEDRCPLMVRKVKEVTSPNDFTELFKRYDWTVEQLGDNSYIADNGTFFVAFSLCYSGYSTVATAVSSLCCEKEGFISKWEQHKKDEGEYHDAIGFYAYSEWGRGNFFQYGGVGNHDHSIYEIESWLK